MIEEAYVSFETAKLLIRKGLNHSDCHCNSYYTLGGEVVYWKDRPNALNVAPRLTLAMATRWLREMHNLFIEIQCYGCGADKKAHFEYSYVISEYVKINNGICTIFGLEKRNAKSRFSSYEEAVEAAIKYCPEHLI